MVDTDIEWADKTWNPTRGCVEVSPGCARCYAKTFSERFRGVAGHPYEQGFDPILVPHKLGEPLRIQKPSRIFVNSMSDLFGAWVPDAYIAAVFGVMAAGDWHRFLTLTKRSERLPQWFEWVQKREREGRSIFPSDAPSWRIGQMMAVEARRLGGVDGSRKGTRATRWEGFDPRQQPWPLPNVLMGVSVENRKHGLPRIEHLRSIDLPDGLRFLSVEPLLEDLGVIDLRGIGWVIVGGESGVGARDSSVEWVRSVVAQCREAEVPVFVKQLGAKARVRTAEGLVPLRLVHRKGGDPAEWPEDLRVQEFPAAMALAA